MLSSPCKSNHKRIRYTILFISTIQVSLAMWAMSSRGGTEAFISVWSAVVLLILCIGGTIIMRKFQSSVFVGFFMGSVVAASQMFFMLFLIICAYIDDRLRYDLSVDGERLTGFIFLVQSLMLGSFAAILAAHRSEILDQKVSLEEDEGTYEAPQHRTVV
ncbi:hypothetical protein ACHAWO_011600 [Cyclotella atomus]|uniref:Uncharacterized protein n=1 Tax=Cyclotella atomus TaxID=382360 RepID=A0ABD3PQN4_9STRA